LIDVTAMDTTAGDTRVKISGIGSAQSVPVDWAAVDLAPMAPHAASNPARRTTMGPAARHGRTELDIQ
jgi:hypothetical protein